MSSHDVSEIFPQSQNREDCRHAAWLSRYRLSDKERSISLLGVHWLACYFGSGPFNWLRARNHKSVYFPSTKLFRSGFPLLPSDSLVYASTDVFDESKEESVEGADMLYILQFIVLGQGSLTSFFCNRSELFLEFM